MSLRSLPTYKAGTILGYRKNGKPIFPIAGGSEPPNQQTGDQTGQQQQIGDQTGQQQQIGDQTGQQQQNTGPVEATDENGVALGFPKETPVADMTPVQQAAYWRFEAKKQQKRVPSNLTELQTAAQKWDEYQRSQQSPADQQLAQVRDQTAAQVREEVAKEAAVELLRVSLHTRGKSAAEIDELVEFVNPERFLNAEKKLDTAKVTSYLDKVAPSGTGGGTSGLPGQGRYQQTPADPAAKGKTEAERRGFKPADRSKSTLIPK